MVASSNLRLSFQLAYVIKYKKKHLLMGGPKPKYDDEITKLFEQGLGADKIAQQLGIKHSSTVSKRLIKLNLKRPKGSNQRKIVNEKINIEFAIQKDKLRNAAENYFKFMCSISGYNYLVPCEESPFDLVVDFGNGWKKIQIKSSYYNPDRNYVFGLTRIRYNSNKRRVNYYKKDEVDYFFLMDLEFNCWLIPFNLLENQGSCTPARVFKNFEIKI